MSSDDLLTTTQAAELLNCSRQHVVDLCDSGVLPHVRIGVHRRIRRSDLDTYLRPALRREDELSLWLNHAYAAKLIQDPSGVIERAQDRLAWLRRTHSGGIDRYFDQWQQALSSGPDAVLAIMTVRSEWGQAMRSASPMSGIGLLTSEERTRIRAAFRTHWRSAHQAAA